MKLSIELPDEIFKRLYALSNTAERPVEIYAAEILITQLENGESNWIRQELAKLRVDVAIATQAILVNNEDVDEREARRWVAEKLLKR